MGGLQKYAYVGLIAIVKGANMVVASRLLLSQCRIHVRVRTRRFSDVVAVAEDDVVVAVVVFLE